jgi:hypothetical protein
MSTIYQNLRTDRQYKAATALDKQQFETLFAIFEGLYIPKPSDPHKKEPVLTDKREALFFVLHYYKAYPSLENMAPCFGFAQSTAAGYLRLLGPILKACLAEHQPLQACLSRSRQAFDKAFADTGQIIIDVTEVPVQRPSDKERQKKRYTGKKKPTPANGSS